MAKGGGREMALMEEKEGRRSWQRGYDGGWRKREDAEWLQRGRTKKEAVNFKVTIADEDSEGGGEGETREVFTESWTVGGDRWFERRRWKEEKEETRVDEKRGEAMVVGDVDLLGLLVGWPGSDKGEGTEEVKSRVSLMVRRKKKYNTEIREVFAES